MARPTRAEAAAKHSEQIIEKRRRIALLLEEIALDNAEEALRTLATAAALPEPVEVINTRTGEIEVQYPTVPRERLDAAKYLLDQVIGRAAPKPAKDDREDDRDDLLGAIRNLRARAEPVHPESGGM